jgi:hypothetical protein
VAIVAGVDEAGVGSVLGPLVVSASAFEVPDSAVDECLWKLLAPAVTRKFARKSAALVIGDSKKLYNRKSPRALWPLERGVLAMLHTRRQCPTTLGDLLVGVTRNAHDESRTYPWYCPPDGLPLPRCLGAVDVALAGNSLAVQMRKAGVRLLGIRAEPVFAGEFNRVVRATRNKGTTVLDVTGRLLACLWRRSSSGQIRIHVDRQGGRMRYMGLLERVFDGCRFRILDETDTRSAYEVSDQRRVAEVSFCVDAEDGCLPVALASMTSKYIRELFMAMLNAFWAGRVGGLASTAGYYSDGRRFFGEIQPTMRKLEIHQDMLYRCR